MSHTKIESQKNPITEGSIWKQLLAFFFPILLGTFFQQLYNTVDAVVVGNFVGKEALAAVGGSTGTLINLLVGFFVGISAGGTVILSQYYGAGKADETERSVHTAIALSLSGGIVLTVLGLFFSGLALRVIHTPADIFGYALSYMRIYFLGMAGNLVYNISAGILRAVGDSRTPLYFLIFSSLLNLLLDLLFVLVFSLGVNGAALATILSQAVSAMLALYRLSRTGDIYRLSFRCIRFDLPILSSILKIGLPNGFQSVMYTLSNIIIQASINSFGTDVVASWTAYSKIDGLFWMIMSAFGIAATTFSGQNFGAGRYTRVRQSVRTGLLMSAVSSILLSGVLLAAGPAFYRLFTKDPTVIDCGLTILRTLAPFYVTYIFIEILSGTIRGTGDSLIPTLITCIGICGTRVFWISAIVPRWHDIRVVALSYPAAWIFTSFAFILYYQNGGWLRRQIPKTTVESTGAG